jgi:hypothetical protein
VKPRRVVHIATALVMMAESRALGRNTRTGPPGAPDRDNSFLFLIGGTNRGHPDVQDIALAEAFADSLLQGGGT